jgi:hypothetical protein
MEKNDLINQIRKISKLLLKGTNYTGRQLRSLSLIELEDELIRLLKVVSLPNTIIKEKIKTVPQSHIKNINWYKNYKKWMVSFKKDRKQTTVGYYSCLEDAIKAKEEYERNRQN